MSAMTAPSLLALLLTALCAAAGCRCSVWRRRLQPQLADVRGLCVQRHHQWLAVLLPSVSRSAPSAAPAAAGPVRAIMLTFPPLPLLCCAAGGQVRQRDERSVSAAGELAGRRHDAVSAAVQRASGLLPVDVDAQLSVVYRVDGLRRPLRRSGRQHAAG